jgi:Ca-activated chloride channel family protein
VHYTFACKEEEQKMFTIKAYHNPYLRVGQHAMQAIISVGVEAHLQLEPAPLALAIALDRSGSMEGTKIRAARNGAIKVVQALDASMLFMIVAFNDQARVIFGPVLGTSENKLRAINAIQNVHAANGTRMSTALHAIVDKFDNNQSRATKILFLTDGRNEGELRSALERAVVRCREARIGISAWGIGVDWDEKELRFMADATHGSADIIPTPNQIESAFSASFNEMRKTAIMNASMGLWMPAGVTIKGIQQVYPNIVSLNTEPDPTNPRQVLVSLGSFAAGDQRDYLLDLEMPAYAPGQQFLLVRPSIKYNAPAVGEQIEKSTQSGWVFVQWTEDSALAAQIEEHIAHYTNQEELARAIKEGQEALAAGDAARATALLGRALEMSERTRNEKITRLLQTIVLRDSKGTIHLNAQADAVARKTLAINVGRTSKLK